MVGTRSNDGADQAALDQPRAAGGVQSVQRAFAILEAIAAHGAEASISQIAQSLNLPAPTTHRLLRTLAELGYVRQEDSRQYILGPKLVTLGNVAARSIDSSARAQLRALVDALGESANLAALDGDRIVYLAQEQSGHSMRMFTEVGRRVSPHCTAVGKAILAHAQPEDVRALFERNGMSAETAHTITEIDAFLEHLEGVRRRGFALDDEEQEIGVRCVAVRVPDERHSLAISISGPAPRMTEEVVLRAAKALTTAAAEIAGQL